jgi:hypothetical protein
MAREFETRPFPLLGYEAYLDLVVDFLERLAPEIILQRLFALAPESQLLGPHWGRTKAEMQRDIVRRLVQRHSWQGRLWKCAGRQIP